MTTIGKFEPKYSDSYDNHTYKATKSILYDLSRAINNFSKKLMVVGGIVPGLLIDEEQMRYIGTVDIDMGVSVDAFEKGEFHNLIDLLYRNGYRSYEELNRFHLTRRVSCEGNQAYVDVAVDFLLPRNKLVSRDVTESIDGFSFQTIRGLDLAAKYCNLINYRPKDELGCVDLRVCSIPAFLVMKGFALEERYKAKDAYDIYFCVKNYRGGKRKLASECRALFDFDDSASAFEVIANQFRTYESFGPICVRRFMEDAKILGGRPADFWQNDSFHEVSDWLNDLKQKE